jgi:hypothetical protein
MRRHSSYLRSLIVAACAAVAVALLAVPAVAGATRYATPTGKNSSSCATVAEACSLRTAIEGFGGNGPKAGEEVIVEPGTYEVTSKIEPQVATLEVRGAPGQPRPVITSKNVTIFGTFTGGHGMNLAHVELEDTVLSSEPAIRLSGATVEGVLLIGEPSGNVLFEDFEGLLKDSVVIAVPGSTSGAVGIVLNEATVTETLRNDTIVAESAESANAGAIELDSQSIKAGFLTINAFNTIAINTAGVSDVIASQRSRINMFHSDYAKPSAEAGGEVVNGGGSVTAVPLFVNAAADDFAELATSPTVDAGAVEEANGPVDFEGAARTSGASTDIGAYELQVPAPTPTEPKGGGTGKGVGTGPRPPLLISGLKESHRVWPAVRRKGRKGPVGTSFSFSLNAPATVTLSFKATGRGRKIKGRCAARSRSNAGKPHCALAVGSITISGRAGTNSVAFKGLLHGHPLAPGAYTVLVTAVDASARRASAGPLAFTVVR